MEFFWIDNKINYRKFRPFFTQLIIESPNHGFSQKKAGKGNYRKEKGIIESS